MLTRIEALNFRCLRYVSRSLDPFHVLVGPNASGKTTFFDVVGFVSRLLNDGLEAAIEEVTPNPLDLLFGRSGHRFELAIEARLPESLKMDVAGSLTYVRAHDDTRIRYEVAVILDENANAEIDTESVFLLPSGDESTEARSETINRNSRFQRCLPYIEESNEAGADRTTLVEGFPKTLKLAGPLPRLTIRREDAKAAFFIEDWFGNEVDTSGVGHSMRLSGDKSALATLLDDYSMNPASIWLKQFLMEGITRLSIDGTRVRFPSPPANKRKSHPNGLSMPWTVLGMSEANRAEWIEHIQTALPDIIGIRPVIRGEDRHCYLMIQYQNLGEIPQWMVSEGTLRLLALTLPAFLSQPSGILLVEEPENGLHPKALETVFQALSYISDTQVMMSTHSPQLLVLAEPHQILCFAKDSSGAVDIVRGDQHPTLKDWQRDISLGTLFAAGALE